MKMLPSVLLLCLVVSCREAVKQHRSNILVAGRDTIDAFDDTLFLHSVVVHDTVFIHDTVWKIRYKYHTWDEGVIYDGSPSDSGMTVFSLDSFGKVIPADSVKLVEPHHNKTE